MRAIELLYRWGVRLWSIVGGWVGRGWLLSVYLNKETKKNEAKEKKEKENKIYISSISPYPSILVGHAYIYKQTYNTIKEVGPYSLVGSVHCY